MKLIDRYVGWQLLFTASLAVTVLSVVLVLANVFKKLLEVLVTNDAPVELVLSFLAYILPFSLTYTIPWGFLTAVLLVFGKMSGENELIAFRANGVSIPRLTISVFILAFFCVGICYWINVDVAPRAQARVKEALYNIATSNPLAMFGSDRIIDAFPGRKIYVERNQGKELFNLLVYEQNDSNEPTKVVFAHRGLLETDREKKELLLHIFDARYEQRSDDDPDNLAKIRQGITMQESTLPISLETLHDKKGGKGISAMTSGELLERLKEEEKDTHPTDKDRIAKKSAARSEMSKRFSFSLASLALGLIGIPLAITAHRKETSVGILFSFAVGLSYFFFIIIADGVKEKPQWHPELLMWVPNLLCLIFGGWMFLKMSRR